MQGGFLPDWFSPAFWAGLTALFAISWWHLRHLGFAALTVIGPLLGYAAAALGCSRLHVHFPASPSALLIGFVVASFFASGMEARIANGLWVREAARETLRTEGWKLSWSLLLASGVAASPFSAGLAVASFIPGVAIALAGTTGISAVAIGARVFSYGEEFIATVNRIAERRERNLDILTFVVQSRWGWSVSGIALVFAAIAFFGGEAPAATMPTHRNIMLPFATVVLAATAYAATRDVRRTIAFLLSAALLALLAFWIFAKVPALDAKRPALAILSAFGAAIIPVLIASAESAGFARAGDNFSVASLRMFERTAVPALFATIAGVIFTALSGWLGESLLILCGGVMLIVTPALTTAIYGVFPPRASLDAYRIR